MNNQVSTIGIVVDTNNGQYRVWSRDHDDVHLVPKSNKPPKLGDFVIVKRNPNALTTDDYKIIPALYETYPNGRRLQVSMDQHLDFDQTNIKSHFFGDIAINNCSTKEGKWRVTIETQQSTENHQKSTWILKEISGISEEDSRIRTTRRHSIGVTVHTNYAWCRENPPGGDVKLVGEAGPRLPIATWILMTFTSESQFQKNRRPFKFTPMEPIHAVFENNKTIAMSLECFIKESATPTDISHPAVGLILNSQNVEFNWTGKYKIHIRRSSLNVGKDGLSRSVWFLRTAELLETLNVKITGNVPKSVTTRPPKFGIITSIRRMENQYEEVYFWTMDDHKEGRIYPEAYSEKLDIQIGVVFSGIVSNFVCLPNSKYKYQSPEFTLHGLYKEVRLRYDALEVHIFTDKYFPPTPSCKYHTVIHKDFGIILDNRQLLQTGGNWNLMLHFWIKRCFVDGKRTWVVCERID